MVIIPLICIIDIILIFYPLSLEEKSFLISCLSTPGLDLCDPEKGLGISADWSCTDGTEETSCVMSCPQGTRYESPPADKYHCSLAGTWTPSFAPKCIPSKYILQLHASCNSM